ncbi:MAG: phospholipase D-like domain-containing protein [Gemmatimonadota bacterium]|nr:phospholipase D-like domain-containing protein [Gemmatimonadota bacterium]
MPAFVSPLVAPAGWTCAIVPSVVIPATLRHAGYTLRGVRATRAAGSVALPATGILRRAAAGTGVAVEVQVLPFPIRAVASAVPGGLPTFYLVFDDAAGLAFMNGDGGLGGDLLRTATAVTIACGFEDRVVRDVALWADQIGQAITAGGGDPSTWASFRTALTAATNTGPTAPVLLLGHDGQPLTGGAMQVVFGPAAAETVHPVTLTPADGGDLQRAVARLNAAGTLPIANLWGAATSLRVRPVGAGAEFQLARLEDGVKGAREIEVTPAARHVCLTDLHTWLAPQTVTAAPGVTPLDRLTRGNRVRPLVNGPEFYDDLFEQLRDAATPGGGFHLAGWAMFPQTKFVRRRTGDDSEATLVLSRADELIGADGVPLTLEQAATRIAAGGGASRFLPARFVQFEPGAVVDDFLIYSSFAMIGGLFFLSGAGVNFARTDQLGTLIVITAWAGITAAVVVIVAGSPFIEPNNDAVTVLGGVAGAQSQFSAYPASVLDNPLAAPTGNVVFATLYDMVRRFGVYHQKLSVVRTAAGHVGYCGGIDLNPDRLDDVHHLARSPYHDLHARIDGPAVRDLALTFEQRWLRDGGGTAPAFPTPAAGSLPAAGDDVAQVARTYFQAAAPARALEFAPAGDRTVLDTVLQAIMAAREFIYIEDQYFTPPASYRTALLAKLTSGAVKKVIIVMPGINDQPFGEVLRSSFIAELRTAAPPGVLQIGYPRRRPMLPDNDIRASSGRLRLEADLPATGGIAQPVMLGPKPRVPGPPFWLQVDGELMYVHGAGIAPSPDAGRIVSLVADRGADNRLLSATAGPAVRAHSTGAPASVVDLTNIYVHAKMMIVDDVFLSVGSANLNRRGFCHDGELNVFTLPEALRTGRANPIAALRRRLWAEMLDLPLAVAEPLLEEPVAASALFERSFFAGNRFAPIEALPRHLILGLGPGSWFTLAMSTLVATLGAVEGRNVFDTIADPTSSACTD